MEQQIYFEALNDPIRRRILVMLLDTEERCVCEMHGLLDASQPKVSRHLGVLREAGLVLARRDGVWMHYRIHPDLPAWAYRILLHMKDGMPALPASASVAKSHTCAPACATQTN
jgi:ArsR family transcriptional regulator